MLGLLSINNYQLKKLQIGLVFYKPEIFYKKNLTVNNIILPEKTYQLVFF